MSEFSGGCSLPPPPACRAALAAAGDAAPAAGLATLPDDLTLRILAATDPHTRHVIAPQARDWVCRAWRALAADPANATLLAADVWVDGVDRAARADGVDARLRLDVDALLCWLAPRAGAVRCLTADDAHLPPHAWVAVLGALPHLDQLDLLGDAARTLAWHALPRDLRALRVTGCEGSLGHDQLAALPAGLTCLRLEAAGAPDGGTLRSGSPFLAGFPAPVLALTGLRSLSLASRGVAALPDGVAALAGLTRLAVMHAGLTRLPDGLGELAALRELDLRGNLLLRDARSAARALAPLARLARTLASLDLSRNGARGDDTVLPGVVFGLSHLTALRAAGNANLDVPPDLACLARLRLLDLRDCGLRDYPPGLEALTGLHTLLLGRNARLARRGLPSCASIADLAAECDEAHAACAAPGGAAGSLGPACLAASLGSASLGSAPGSLASSPARRPLATLLAGSPVAARGGGGCGGGCTSSTSLDSSPGSLAFSPARRPLAPLAAGLPAAMRGGTAVAPPPSTAGAVAHLTNVTVLDLSRTGLRELPPGAEALRALAELRLCHAAAYPGTGFAWPSLARCPTLRRLDISGSYCEQLPLALGALPCLAELTACECGLTRLGPAVRGLTSLARLVLDGNRLQLLPADELSLMPELEDVSLVDNLNMQLPPTLGALGVLRRLRRLDARKVARGLCGGRPWTARSMWCLARAYEDLRAADPARDWASVLLL